MESVQPKYETMVAPGASSDSFFSGKNTIIAVLVILLVLSFVGINLLDYISDFLKGTTSVVAPIVKPILGILGYTTGTVINKTADVVSDTAKAGIDVAEGTVQDLGDMLITASNNGVNTAELDNALNISRNKAVNQPDDDDTSNPIQNPISSNKGGWCLVGEMAERRGCVNVDDANKCMSGQVFPSKAMCMNPAQ